MKQGDRVETLQGKKGTVVYTTCGWTGEPIASVQLDDASGPEMFYQLDLKVFHDKRSVG